MIIESNGILILCLNKKHVSQFYILYFPRFQILEENVKKFNLGLKFSILSLRFNQPALERPNIKTKSRACVLEAISTR